MRISDWSSYVCSSDLAWGPLPSLRMRCQPFVLTKGAMAPPDDRRSRSASNRMEAARAKLPELFLLLPRFHIPVPHVPHMGMVRPHASIQTNDLSIDVPRSASSPKPTEHRCPPRSSPLT